MSNLYVFLSGAAMSLAFSCALFFFKFWRATRDRLFLIFAISFGILGCERILLFTLRETQSEPESATFYLVRFTAFLLIVIGIWDKNRD